MIILLPDSRRFRRSLVERLVVLCLICGALVRCRQNQDPSESPRLFERMPVAETNVNFSNDLTFNNSFNIYTYKDFYAGGGVVVGGEKIYADYCAACHQRDGQGTGGRYPPLVDTDWVTGDKDRLITVILQGLEGRIEVKGETYNGVMPQHSFLSDDEVAEVATYIRQNFGNKASAITPEEVGEVRHNSPGEN